MENEENILEQPKGELTTDSHEASKILDRFACVEDLEKAYKSLRAEFTKKSQRLSELEQAVKEKTSASVAEIKVDVPLTVVHAQECDNSLQTLKGAASDEIIKNYLLSVAASKKQTPAVIANYAVDFAPARQPHAPKSMSETTKEVENFFIRRKL